MPKYDAVIIGSGQAGNPLSHKLADRDWKVALVEKENLGGSCVNTGCTPTKTMMASAQVAHYARHASRWGVHTDGVQVDLSAVVKRKDQIVDDFRTGQQRQVDRRDNLDLYRGTARFLDRRTIEVEGVHLEGNRIFINAGTRPTIPQIGGLDEIGFLTNASIMELTTIPEQLLVVGGGYIGLEFGQMFARFGSQVTVIHRSQEILPREDQEVASELRKCLESEKIRFLLNTRPSAAEKSGGSIRLHLESPDGPVTVSGTHVLIAAGRTPNTEELNLEKTGVETDADGFIRVNAQLETNVKGIWALGDVKGGPAFTHISYNDHQIVYANLIEGKNLTIEGRLVPYAVFTDPQLGGVGLTEREARKRGYRLKIGRLPVSHVARALERAETAGLMKVVVDASTDQILGASILSPEGGELVQLLCAVMRAELPYTFLKGAVYIHPTMVEGFFGLMEKVQPAD